MPFRQYTSRVKLIFQDGFEASFFTCRNSGNSGGFLCFLVLAGIDYSDADNFIGGCNSWNIYKEIEERFTNLLWLVGGLLLVPGNSPCSFKCFKEVGNFNPLSEVLLSYPLECPDQFFIFGYTSWGECVK